MAYCSVTHMLWQRVSMIPDARVCIAMPYGPITSPKRAREHQPLTIIKHHTFIVGDAPCLLVPHNQLHVCLSKDMLRCNDNVTLSHREAFCRLRQAQTI